MAARTTMPANEWDYLAGHKQRLGNHAEAYQLEDHSTLVKDHQYLVPYLSITEPRDPLEAGSPYNDNRDDRIKQLEQQVLALSKLLTEKPVVVA